MKKAYLLMAAITALAACKKKDSSPQQFLLAKIFVNGQLESEFVFDDKKRLLEENSYVYLNGTMNKYQDKYMYDATGKLKEQYDYETPDIKPYGKSVFTLDAAGRISRKSAYSLTGTDSGEVYLHIDHEYNASNRVIKQVWKDENEKVTDIRELSYYPNGNMRTSESYNVYNNVASKNFGSSYAPSDTTLPASFYQVSAYPLNFIYNELISPHMTHFLYDNGQVKEERKVIMSARKYNDQGLVIQQTITIKKIKPAGPDEVKMMQYEYKAY